MTIATILARKGGNVVCVGPGEDAVSVAATLSSHRIGSVLVQDASGKLVAKCSEARWAWVSKRSMPEL